MTVNQGLFLGNIDFSSSSWMSSFQDGQKVIRTVDGHVFEITSSGNMIYINGFPVTINEWNQVLNGKKVNLSFQGKTATLSSIGLNIMFNGKSMTNGSRISNQVSFSSTSRASTSFSSSGNLPEIKNIIKYLFHEYIFREFRS